ncbi:MAG: aldo/keto reductase [Candidatus Promineifilaceae bacterium]|nr:aldo/keto reductase [Candidatus Promineifilaceae bacterium]
MEYRRLGRTGLRVSTICLGTMQFGWTADEATSHEIMSAAVDRGCNFFDTADVYSSWVEGNEGGVSERIIGNWLASGAASREHLVLATKVRGRMGDGPNDEGLSRAHILDAVEASLRRLQTDYIDLYQVHYPDESTPLEETMEALDDLVRSGKVRYVGCSNYRAWQLMKSLWVSDVGNWCRFDSLQPHYNLLHRAEFERELQAVALDQGIGVIPYSPLGGGFLTGKYRRNEDMPESPRADSVERRYMNERGFAAIDLLEELAGEKDATIAQVAIGWLLANSTVTSAIIGANSVRQLQETLDAAEVALSEEEKTRLDELTDWR